MYYNNGSGKGKLKCTVSVFCDFTNYWFVYTKMEYPDAEYCTWFTQMLKIIKFSSIYYQVNHITLFLQK